MAAVALIVADLQRQGIPIVLSAVNGAMEAALQELRSREQPPTDWPTLEQQAKAEEETPR